jgi:hypothetical protein
MKIKNPTFMGWGLILVNQTDGDNIISLLNLIDQIKSIDHLSKTCMVSIQVLGVLSPMTNEELGTSRVSSCVCHR